MKYAALGLVALLALSALAGCRTPGEQVGTAMGAVGGALVGGAIDSQNPWRGAAIGATAGGLTGLAIGHAASEEPPPPPPPQPMPYKVCPRCSRTYGPDVYYCPGDGAYLIVPRP